MFTIKFDKIVRERLNTAIRLNCRNSNVSIVKTMYSCKCIGYY